MQKQIIISLVLIASAFTAGYFFASKSTNTAVADHELAALMHYTAAISYLQKDQVDNAKYILYVGTDGALNELSKRDAAALSQSNQKALKKILISLDQSWNKDHPFDDEKSVSLKAMPEWVEMRNRNDAFRKNYPNAP